MTIAESLARKAAPCRVPTGCGYKYAPNGELYQAPCDNCLRLRPAIQAAIEEAIAACAGLADRWSDDPVAQQIAVNIYALRTDDVEDGG